MKVIYKKIIAFICALSMIVSTLAMNPGIVSAYTDEDGFTQLSKTENVEQAWGKWSKIYKASTWAQPTDVSIKGEGASFDDLAIKINSSNGATTGDERWAIQAHYPVSGLDASKTYKCTIKYTSTKPGNMLYKPDGIAGKNDKIYPAVEGENTITDTITGVTGFTAVFALCGMPNGCIVDFTSISVVEESEETTTTVNPGEAKWKKIDNSLTDNDYYYDYVNMTVSSVVNVQKAPWAAQVGIYMTLPAVVSEVSVNGTVTDLKAINGSGVVLYLSALTKGENEVVITHANGTSKITIKRTEKEGTTPETTTVSEPVTTPEIIDGTELLKDTEFEEGNVSHWDEYGGNKYTNQGNGKLKVEIPAYESGDNWATQLVQKNIQLYEGKWYVAQFKITSDVDKSFQLLIQSDGNSGGDWTVFAKEDVNVLAGETKTVKIQFQADQSTASNVLYGIMMGYINGASEAANVTIEDVSLKVYNDEQQISGTQTVLLTSNDVSVSGFQMKTNWSEEDENQGLVGFRTVCKAPNVGGKVTVGKVSYTVAKFGTLYTIEPDKGIPNGTSFTASGTLLKSYNLNDETAETVNPFTLAATATENAIKEKDDTYSSYVQTMQDTIENLHPGNKIHVRAFVVTTGGTIIYSTKSVSTCIARVASYMYQKSLASNYRGHEYLYKSILNVAQFVPAEKYTGYFTTKDNPYYRDSKVVYGWNDNLYTPDGDDYMNIKPDVFLGKDYLSATTGYSDDPASVNKNTRGGVISISGVKYDNGISTNANGYFEYSVPKNAKYFMGIAGIDDSVASDSNYGKASVICEVSFDGSTAITTGVLTYGKSQYIKVEVPQGATKVTIKFNDAGDGNTCDRASMGNAGWLVDKNYQEKTTTYNTDKDPSDITRIYVFTEDSNVKITKEKKSPASIQVISADGNINSVSDGGTIKLRGNSTALADKPAYNISFTNEQKVFKNAVAGKKWCLLANAYDKSMLRNKLAMDLGKKLGNVDTPEEHYADLYINGRLMGTYLVSEPADNGRSGISYDSNDDNELMFEWEREKVESGQTYYVTSLGVRFVVDEPEGIDTATAKYTNWVNTLTNFETALKNTSSYDVLKYIDIDSFVDMYIVNELFKAVDFGYSSVKFYTKKDSSGNVIIHAGCLWDFDLSSGNSSVEECRTTDSFRGQSVNEWFGLLMQNTTFKNKVIAKYKGMQSVIKNIYMDNDLGTNQIDSISDKITKSRIRNYTSSGNGGAGWSESNADSAEVTVYPYGYNTLAPYNTYTYEQHIEYLKDWLKTRNEWICSQWNID